MKQPSFTDRVMAFFRSHPQEWIDAIRFESVGGRQGWRTRISEARLKFEASGEGTITNSTKLVKLPDGGRYTSSRYMFIPAVRQQPSLYETNRAEFR